MIIENAHINISLALSRKPQLKNRTHNGTSLSQLTCRNLREWSRTHSEYEFFADWNKCMDWHLFFSLNKFFGIIWRKVRWNKKSHHEFTTPQPSATPNPPLFRKLDTFTFLIFSLSDLALERLRTKKETFDCLQLELIFSTFIQCW